MPLHPRHSIIVIVSVHRHPQADLAEIVNTRDAAGFLLGLRQGRKQQGRENGDNGDDHQQFD